MDDRISRGLSGQELIEEMGREIERRVALSRNKATNRRGLKNWKVTHLAKLSSPKKCKKCGIMTRDEKKVCILCRIGDPPWTKEEIEEVKRNTKKLKEKLKKEKVNKEEI